MEVWKFPLEVHGHVQRIEMPKDAQPCAFQLQRGTPTLWMIVDPTEPSEPRRYVLVGTGHRIPWIPSPAGVHHVGTVQLQDGALVLHCFELRGA